MTLIPGAWITTLKDPFDPMELELAAKWAVA